MNNETQICPTCKQRIDPGDGYRLLSVGEIRTAGDEFYDRGQWRPIRNVWLSALKTNSAPTRRKIPAAPVPPAIDPEEGFRLLSVGEIRRTDDESFTVGRGWNRIRADYVRIPLKNNSSPTRRKIPVSSHDHATDSGQRACPVCSGEAVGVVPVGIKPTVPQPKVCPGFGYRLLEIGEVIRKSDEAYANYRWQSFEDEGKIFDGKLFFFPRRRKIKVPPDPGPGYRLLADGETILKSDQYHSSEGWIATSFAGGQAYADIYRRKIEMPPAGVWTGRSIETRNMKAETTICPGEGYRLLAPNEILEVGDEFFVEVAKAWEKFYQHTAGQPLCPGATARRRIPPTRPDPGAGYRLLAVGEVRQRGDEYFVQGKWDGPTMDVGHPVLDTSFAYRRKVSPKHYRIVSAGEIIQTTDEIWADSKGWFPAKHLVGFVVSENALPIRREINSFIGGPA